jgi:hypothetical protein
LRLERSTAFGINAEPIGPGKSQAEAIGGTWTIFESTDRLGKKPARIKNAFVKIELRIGRGGRVVEGAALEMLFRGNFNEGSNPSLSVAKRFE